MAQGLAIWRRSEKNKKRGCRERYYTYTYTTTITTTTTTTTEGK